MPISEETKKKLLYGAGALASIIGVVYIFKKSSGSSMPISSPQYPSGSSGGSASNSALTAAQIQAATQLTVAQSQKEIALAQIAASKENLATQTQAQIALAKTQEQGKALTAAMQPGGAIPTATKSLFDTIKEALAKIGIGNPSGVELDSQGNPMVLGASGLLSNGQPTVSPGNFSPSGTCWDALGFGGASQHGETIGWNTLNQLTGGEQPYVTPMSLTDYYQGSIGSGGSDWFGSTPGDFTTSITGGMTENEDYWNTGSTGQITDPGYGG
jgi:hypothetical protein